MRPRRSTTSTIACVAPTGESSEPGVVSNAGAEAESCATAIARERNVRVEASMEMAGDDDVDDRAEHDHGDHRRECRGEDRPDANAHRPTTNPTPRIVSITGGSPSFRRRFET